MATRFARARRMTKLPPYLFIEIDKKKKAAQARGIDLVDLGVGDPDLPTPSVLLRELARASRNPAFHQYPLGSGLPAFRQAAARWFEARFGVGLDPATEVVALIGSKEGIGHFPVAFVDPGDVVLCPDPAYPVYRAGTIFSEGVPVEMPLRESNDFLPDLGRIPASALRRARLMWLNYPNNPTAATASLAFFKEAVRFCKKHGIILAHDMAYSEVYYDGERPPSILEVPGARDVAIEFHSLSKTFNMTGWRIGFAVGKADLVAGLASVKGNLDSGVVSAIQAMGIAALEAPASLTAGIRNGLPEAARPLRARPPEAGLRGAHAQGLVLRLGRAAERQDEHRLRQRAAREGRHRRDAGQRLRPCGRGLHPHDADRPGGPPQAGARTAGRPPLGKRGRKAGGS